MRCIKCLENLLKATRTRLGKPFGPIFRPPRGIEKSVPRYCKRRDQAPRSRRSLDRGRDAMNRGFAPQLLCCSFCVSVLSQGLAALSGSDAAFPAPRNGFGPAQPAARACLSLTSRRYPKPGSKTLPTRFRFRGVRTFLCLKQPKRSLGSC
jgi:hypothetical protein